MSHPSSTRESLGQATALVGASQQKYGVVLPKNESHFSSPPSMHLAAEKTRTAENSTWRESLGLVAQHVPYARRMVRSGERVYLCGDSFDTLYMVNSGIFTVMNLTADGREQPAGFYFKGDWLGFDGIPTGRHGCSAIALDCGEVWAVRYDSLQHASIAEPRLMRSVFSAISTQLAYSRDAMLSMERLRPTLESQTFFCSGPTRWSCADREPTRSTST